ncbi:MAG: prepilin-type N-terminal cleavage/methylation domain-containing protein [Planctomycetota bacterium]
MPSRSKQHGFTIVELIVTLAILGLMLFLVNQIFQETSVAVTTSVQVSKTVAQSRSINEQITDDTDTDAMIGPGVDKDGGFIVIVQHAIQNVKLLDPQTLNEVTIPELRSDQLLFIRDAEGLKSMTPAGAGSYGTNLIGQPGDRAKVWYGHALRTPPDGTSPTHLLGADDAGLDSIGSNFIFARQAMLFNPTNAATSLPLSDPLTTGYTYANEGYATSAVTGSTYTGTNQSYLGLTDVIFQDYGPATPGGTTLLSQLTDTSLTVAQRNTLYANTTYRVDANRLRVNPAPSATDTNYASWAIAQGHPILAQSCSEIIVDFAADMNGDGQIDTAFRSQGANDAPIFWYDTLSRNPARATTSFAWQNAEIGMAPLAFNFTNKNVFVFRVDDDTPYTTTGSPVSSWPYLIRIRYRLHDTRGRLTSNYRAFLTDGVDNDGDGNADAADNENDEDKISGQWFERIIVVPRP